jgi:hypothetical protein
MFGNLGAAALRVEEHTLTSLEWRITETVVSAREDQPLMSGCRFGDTRSARGSLRHDANVVGINAVVVDHDGATPVGVAMVKRRLVLAGISFLVHTTSRHTKERPRWHVLVPLSRDHPPSELTRFVEQLNSLLGGVLTPESGKLSQSWFWGRVASAAEFEIFHHDGTPLDLYVNLQRRPLDSGRPVGPTTAKVIDLATKLGPKPSFATGGIGLNANAHIDRPFDGLSGESKNALLREILQLAEIVAIADRPRPEWFPIVFALADAEHRGAADAYDVAKTWSKTSDRFTEADFDRVWNDFKPGGGTTVGTLIGRAIDVGFDFAGWLAAAQEQTDAASTEPSDNGVSVRTSPGNGGTSGASQTGSTGVSASTAASTFFRPVQFEATNLYPVPWLVNGLLIRGEVTILAGQGGGAKTALMICIAVAMACGRGWVGPFTITTRQGGGLRVGILSGEEDFNRTGLLVAAACSAIALDAAERALVRENVSVHDARESGWRLGEARANMREAIAPEAADAPLAALRNALVEGQVDVLMLDTFATLLALPSEVDNQAITSLMNRLARAARRANCAMLLLHHTPKMTRENAAAQRGEATLIRGGSAIANSARVVVTLTALPAAESGMLALQGNSPDRVRRLEHAKVNDRPPMEPAYLQIISVPVTVHDGTQHAVRAVEFVTLLGPAEGGISDAARNVAMRAVDAGVVDQHGNRLPLSSGSGGKDKARDPIERIAEALQKAQERLPDVHARTAARQVLKHLRDLGCVVEKDVAIPRHDKNGSRKGTRTARGLVARWDLAPWMQGSAGLEPAPEPPGANATVTACAPKVQK